MMFVTLQLKILVELKNAALKVDTELLQWFIGSDLFWVDPMVLFNVEHAVITMYYLFFNPLVGK